MLVEDLKVDVCHKWHEVKKVRKSKKNPTGEKYIEHSDEKVGSISIDWAVDVESLEKLVDVIEDEVFKHDGVELSVTFKSSNW